MDDLRFLRRLSVFSHFTEPLLGTLAACLIHRRCAAGEEVLAQGETSREAYLVRRGAVEIARDTPYGIFSLARLGAGEMFGETSFVDGRPRSGNVTAAGATELLMLGPQTLAAAGGDLRFELAVYWAFWKSLSRKLRGTNDRLSEFFAGGGRAAAAEPSMSPEAGGAFRVDLASKRRLFEEQRLSAMEINFLASLSREEKLAPGQVLFREGEIGQEMFVVLEGKVRISKEIPGVGEEALAVLERGDYFGEMALIDRKPRSADARAHDAGAVVLAIPHKVLEGILDVERVSSRRLLMILCSLIAGRLRELDEKIVGWFILAGGGGMTPA